MTAPQRRPASGQRWGSPLALALGLLVTGGELWRTRSQGWPVTGPTPSRLPGRYRRRPAFGQPQPSAPFARMDAPRHQRASSGKRQASPTTCAVGRFAGSGPPRHRLYRASGAASTQGGGLWSLRCPTPTAPLSIFADPAGTTSPGQQGPTVKLGKRLCTRASGPPTVPMFCQPPSESSVRYKRFPARSCSREPPRLTPTISPQRGT